MRYYLSAVLRPAKTQLLKRELKMNTAFADAGLRLRQKLIVDLKRVTVVMTLVK
jgi:hypothetical protein